MIKKMVTILLMLSFACSAFGELVQIGFSAEISALDDGDFYGWDDSVYDGLGITGYMTYDTSSGDLVPQYSDAGEYYITSVSIIAGNYQFNSGTDAIFSIRIDDSLCRYSVHSYENTFDGIFESDNGLLAKEKINWLGSSISFLDLLSYTGEITTDELPVVFPSISVFDSDKLFLIKLHPDNRDENSRLTMAGTITDIWVIPEPCSVLLLGFGGMVVMRHRRRKNVGG